MYPAQSRPITVPVSFAASGQNTIITNAPTDNKWVFIKQIELIPENATTMQFIAKNLTTNDERDLTSNASYQLGQGFIFENFDAQSPFLFELRVGESLICELSAAVACKGFVTYTEHKG